MLPQQFTLDVRPVASSDAVVRVGAARFTVLTERLIRLEYDERGVFEDQASQTVWYRQQPTPSYTVQRTDGQVKIETAAFSLCWEEGQPFSAKSLSIHVKAVDTVWHPGDVDPANLKGTARTLDFNNGSVPLNDGLISRSGWALHDDSRAFVLNGDSWLEPRDHATIDWYFFAYGRDYRAALRDYCTISGDIPLIPRWILGNWWSRYWAYTQNDFVHLINDFKSHELPLSVCIVDMDWHLTKTGNTSSGWTGYTWNRDLIPDPQGLLNFFHASGLRTALNLHPAEGIHPHEAQYPDMARRMGIDPSTGKPVAFDITDPAFVRAYFEVLHHPYEQMGVDFWWVDWQQGQSCNIPNLDPLWLINHLHFYDAGRDPAKRPFIFSRWGNEGHQRYPIGFSGDSYMTWETLRFEPYMTATASNVAYGWWSHDIGGHISGAGDAELFARWVQFAAFSPVLRIHSAKGFFYDQRPWMFDNAEVRAVLRDALQLRHALIPYLYTMAWRAHQEALPLMLPMYYDYPDDEAAYHCPQQYAFGTELIAAPFVEPADPDTGLSRQVVWLPAGDWYHVFTGESYAGNRWHAIYGALKDIPLFAKAGAIVPMGVRTGWGGIDNPAVLDLHLFAGADNVFTLYEDDGESRAYQQGESCRTTITQRWSDQQLEITIQPAEGSRSLIPAERTFNLIIHGVKASVEVQAALNGEPITQSQL
ncbi:MAG: glycoside hydrolase family 31 protein [Anaerolineae bacterium]